MALSMSKELLSYRSSGVEDGRDTEHRRRSLRSSALRCYALEVMKDELVNNGSKKRTTYLLPQVQNNTRLCENPT